MKHAFFLAPAGTGVGLTTVSLGLVNALDSRGVRVAFFKPISQRTDGASGLERSTHFIRANTTLKPADPIPVAIATKMISEGRLDELLGQVIAAFHDSTATADVVVIEGLRSARGDPQLGSLNPELVKTLNAQVILVASAADKATDQLDDQIEYTAKVFGGLQKLLGVIVNRYPISEAVSLPSPADRFRSESQLLRRGKVQLIGVVPQSDSLTYPRTLDIQRHLRAEVLHAGEMEHRRVKQKHLVSRTVPNNLHTLVPGSILLTAADRNDIIIAATLAALSKVPLAGLILTGDIPIDERIIEFCRPALDTGLPLLRVKTNSYDTATQLFQLSSAVPPDDLERTRAAVEHVAQTLDVEWLISQSKKEFEFRLSPAAFLHQLTEKARAAKKRIVLPEGTEPRTVKAAAICGHREIARCVLLGKPSEVQAVAKSQDIELPDNLEILDPALLRPNYVNPLFEARKHKGRSMEMAASQL